MKLLLLVWMIVEGWGAADVDDECGRVCVIHIYDDDDDGKKKQGFVAKDHFNCCKLWINEWIFGKYSELRYGAISVVVVVADERA